MRIPKRYVEALKENPNKVGLASALALSVASLNPLPLLVGVVAEAAYLLFVPDSKWYEARLSRRHDAEVERRRQQLKEQVLPTLRPEMQDRFTRLEETRTEISAQPMDGQTWFREVLHKLEFLLEKYLLFAGKEAQFRSYLDSLVADGHEVRPRRDQSGVTRVDPDRADGRSRSSRATASPDAAGRRTSSVRPEASIPLDTSDRWVQQAISEVQARYTAEMDEIRSLLENEQDTSTRGVLEKRLDVLQRRHEFAAKIGKILANLSHQLQLLEDTFGLINDEIRARSPEQILADIEDVVWQTNTMTQLLEEMAPFEQLVGRMSP
jgi:hypothetical protein